MSLPKPKKVRKAPRSRSELRPVDKAFIHSVMFGRGILPIEDPTLDMRVPLRQVPVDEARVIKRKFRKQWRKYMKEDIGKKQLPAKATPAQVAEQKARTAMIGNKLGLGKHVPSRHERLERKRLVYERTWEKDIVPMLERFENPEREQKKK